MKFYLFNLDLDQMTLLLKIGLGIVKMYVHTKSKVPSFKWLQIYSLNRYTNRQSQRQTDATEIIA